MNNAVSVKPFFDAIDLIKLAKKYSESPTVVHILNEQLSTLQREYEKLHSAYVSAITELALATKNPEQDFSERYAIVQESV
jgi:hypothetical protein